MPFVSVKCTSCGGEIQLDDQREIGFCVYCGNKVVFQEAIQKMELSGNVSVEGIATLEKLLQNAETFHRLGDFVKENKIFEQVTQDYPEDYRAWWGRALLFLNKPFPNNSNKNNDYDFWKNKFVYRSDSINLNTTFISLILVRNAITLAPEERKGELKNKARSYYSSFFPLLESEKQRLNVELNNNKTEEMIVRIATNKAVVSAGKKAEESTNNTMSIRNTRIGVALFFIFAWVVLLIYTCVNGSLFWGSVSFVSFFVMGFLAKVIYPETPNSNYSKPYRKSYYFWYYNGFINKEIESYILQECKAASFARVKNSKSKIDLENEIKFFEKFIEELKKLTREFD